jgi:ABC-type amino acid transport substrate-binding protein
MAFREQDTSLRDFANTVLAGMKTDGSLDKLQTKWFGGTMATPNTIPAVLP